MTPELLSSFYATRTGPYVARSASDRDPDWHTWYVHGADGVNCARTDLSPTTCLMPKELALAVATELNDRPVTPSVPVELSCLQG